MSKMFGPVLDTSDEFVPVTIETVSDPTGGTVGFSAVATTEVSPSTFTSGTWGAWDSTTSSVVALCPSPVTLSLTAGRYKLFVQWAVGAESPIQKLVGILEVE